MSCTCTKTQIEQKIVTALREALNKNNITPASRFGIEIDIDAQTQRGLFFVVKGAVDDAEADGCKLQILTPDDFGKFKKVSDIINAVSKEFKCKEE
jgi:hypothetical protein